MQARARGARTATKKVIRDGGMDASAALKWGIERPRELASWDPRIEVVEAYRLFRGITDSFPGGPGSARWSRTR
jgi:hypothetical protein